MAENIDIVIPAYNEQENIAGVIEGVRRVLGPDCRIIVVDDASQDKTAQIAKAQAALLIQHPYHMGNGACVKTGLRHAQSEIVVLMDGDGQHSPQDIPSLLSHAQTYDMIIGARKFSYFLSRDIANRI